MTKLFNLLMADINLNGVQLRERCFPSCRERGTKKKFLMRNRTSNLRIPRPGALPLRHRDSNVSEVYYEVLKGFSLVYIIVQSLTFISFSLSNWLNRAISRNLPSQSPCGTNASQTYQKCYPYIVQACYIILGGSTHFAFYQPIYVTQIRINGDSLNFFPFKCSLREPNRAEL